MTPSFTDTPDPHPVMTDLSESEYHRLLSVDRRRLTLELLTDRTAPLSLTECATLVANAEADEGEPRPETVDEVALTLHHIHLPKLSEVNIIEYDPAQTRITFCPSSA